MTELSRVVVATGVGVGEGEAAGDGLFTELPPETPPQPENESVTTKQTRRHSSLFIKDPTNINDCDVNSRAPGCPELLLDSSWNEI